jgi:hypothetical protein
MSDDYTPIYVGDTGNALRATFTDSFGVPYNLARATFALSLVNLNTSEEAELTGTGSWTTVDAANGIAQYAWVSADVATPGIYGVQITVTFPGGPVTFQRKILEIRSK